MKKRQSSRPAETWAVSAPTELTNLILYRQRFAPKGEEGNEINQRIRELHRHTGGRKLTTV